MSVEIPEVPGSFRRFISHIEPRNITEFSYRYGDPAATAKVLASFQARGHGSRLKMAEPFSDDIVL